MRRLGEPRQLSQEEIELRQRMQEQDEREEREGLERFAQEIIDSGSASAGADLLEEYLSGYLRGIEAAGGFGG